MIYLLIFTIPNILRTHYNIWHLAVKFYLKIYLRDNDLGLRYGYLRLIITVVR